MSDTSDNKRVWTSQDILNEINVIIHRSKQKMYEDLKNTNKILYIGAMKEHHEEFFDKFPNLFAKCCYPLSKDDMKQIASMLRSADSIKNGQVSQARAEWILGKDLATKYAPGLLDPKSVMPD